ncbi:putative M08 family peptidase [Kitasatospora cheerisanensis KCTC 2395]|uniref:Putative M08 family peptidase n=1 Tax=Kitasatospora cheerisanensis KCTC 2395 TaxID=1348663 RepID=A0A066YZ07_9ACTN|nr:putative M08 family peptidase [Kitasatospora cheerisanensis KCTC 2395]
MLRICGAMILAGATLFTGAPPSAADQVRNDQWANSYFGLEKVRSIGRGAGVTVAVIDTGVDASHQDLAGSVLEGYDPSGQGLSTKPTEAHGTKMASLIAGHGHGTDGVLGLAPDAKILPIYKDGAGGADAVPKGIRWAVDHGAKVVNISLGSPDAAGSDPALTDAVAYAVQHDVLIVGPTGNSGLGSVESPANEPGVLAVGAIDRTGRIWAQSNYGAQTLISAPGVRIVSAGACAGSQYCIGDGTSDATAYVSGTAALVRAKYPKLTAGQVAERLVKSAKAPAALKGGKLPDPHYGYGILSPYDALTKDIPAGPAQGPLAAVADPTTPPDTDPAQAALPLQQHPSGPAPALILAVAGGAVILLLVVTVLVMARSRRRAAPAVPPPGWPPVQQPRYGPPGPYGQQPGHPQQHWHGGR